MNITVTLNNGNIEWITSDIIKKMYQLAMDSNNTVLFSGYLKSPSGYTSLVEYLNNTFGPGLKIEATKLYLEFEDDAAAQVCATYFGDGVGCTISDLANANFATTVNGVDFGTAFKNAGVVKFNEFKYCTGVTDTSVAWTWPFRNNHTLKEFTLPTSCKTIAAYTFASSPSEGSISPKIYGMENITTMQGFAFWNWNAKQSDNSITAANRIQIDWRNISSGAWSDMYSTSNAFKGDVILPKYPTGGWVSSGQFSLFNDDRGQYITKIVFPETFTCDKIDVTRANSCNVFIFLTQTPANGQISMWRNQNWGGNDRHLYVPRTLYNSLDLSATASNGTVTYSSVLKINYGCVPEPLDNYANISDDNKDELVSYGCTATGSTGNWTIKAPGEA